MAKTQRKKTTVKQRGNNGNLKPFKKGTSGNPKGRPKKEACIPDILRAQGSKPLNKKVKKNVLGSHVFKGFQTSDHR